MADYQALARQWRPAQFDEIVGQTLVIKALMNAITSGRLHHAYLFTGSRGIGKTSIARILAKALRCPNQSIVDGWVRSCGTCSDCKEIAMGQSVDVLEIDGASNNGVDAVREIRDATAFMPSSGSRKIYVIDEVHMLTTAAFNALLKTLEEPPPHITFIFATTEAHKIPATILSRCQLFEFKRVTIPEIEGRLRLILKKESIEADDRAIGVIAEAADGSMRDALSLLDQVIALSGTRAISGEIARQAVGLIETETVLSLIEHVLARRAKEALAVLRDIYSAGHDLRVLTRSVIEVLHDLILIKVGAFPEDARGPMPERFKTAAALRPLEELDLVFQTLHHSIEIIGRSSQPRIYLEIVLIKCALADGLIRAVDLQQPERAIQRPVAAAAPLSTPHTPAPAPARAATPAAAPGPKTWEGLVAHLNRSRPLIASALSHAIPGAWPESGGQLLVNFEPKDSFKAEQLKSRANEEAIRTAASEYLGYPVRLLVSVLGSSPSAGSAGTSLAEKKRQEVETKTAAAREAAASHPVIQEAKSLFGGTLGPVEVA